MRVFIRFEKACLSPEELDRCYRYYYGLALTAWGRLPGYMKKFLENLIEHDWQRFLDYMVEDTVVSRLRYELCDANLDLKLLYLNEISKAEDSQTVIRLCFSFHLAFNTGKKNSIHALRKILYEHPLITPDLMEFLEHILYKYMEEQEKKKTKEG
ncbi:MAG: hypothetical protein LUH10_14355 [Tannerellaceae bacterium]|nr:hypothetical protein [Tannerellaceae bacterium]